MVPGKAAMKQHKPEGLAISAERNETLPRVAAGAASYIVSLLIGCLLEVVVDLARHGVHYIHGAAPFAFLDRILLNDFAGAIFLLFVLLVAVIALTWLMEKFAIGWHQKMALVAALVVMAWIDPYGHEQRLTQTVGSSPATGTTAPPVHRPPGEAKNKFQPV
jgi:hypothetical protein